MYSKRLILTTLFVLISLFLFSQQSYNERIKQIRKVYKIITEAKNLDVEQRTIEGESSEGATLQIHRDSLGNVRKLVVTYYGETGKLHEEYYLLDSKLFFAFTQEYQYNRPIYMDEEMAKQMGDTEFHDPQKTLILENRYYFDENGNLIRWIDSKKSMNFDKTLLDAKCFVVMEKFNLLLKKL